jgi:hypothetical protein
MCGTSEMSALPQTSQVTLPKLSSQHGLAGSVYGVLPYSPPVSTITGIENSLPHLSQVYIISQLNVWIISYLTLWLLFQGLLGSYICHVLLR